MGNEIKHLSTLLADTYLLYLNTQNVHWNVEGPHFFAIHAATEKQYQELALTVDEIAERIRALGAKSPATLTSFHKISEVKELPQDLDMMQMVRHLLDNHRQIINTIKKAFEEDLDKGTEDLFIERLEYHEKTAWMFQSFSA